MRTRILDPVALATISPTSLRSYALFEGWEKSETYGANGEVYNRRIGSRDVEIILPVTDKIGDYPSVVAQLIAVFAHEGDLDELAVYRDLTQVDRDVIRCRAPEANDDGSISINSGVDLITSSRNLLGASACSALEPRPYFHVGKVQQANEYMDRVRLGQTERGSFVVTLLAPVPPRLDATVQTELWPDLHSEPYERQVTRVFARGLEAAADALTRLNRGMGIGAFESVIKDGVSANLCEAVAAIAEQSNGAELSVTWARTRPAPIQRSHVAFSRKDAEPLREVARQFRLREPRSDVTLLGTTTKLQRPTKQFSGRVTFATFIDDSPKSVTVELPREDYERAVEAHKRRQPIMIVGDLVPEGQRWHLRNPRGLSVAIPES